MSRPSSRQELYDRIRKSSKDEVILEEMIRLGFWPERREAPFDPAADIKRRGELERELRALCTEATRLRNIDALKREARRRRMAESRRRRQENKQRKLRERAERAAAWREQKQRDIIYLGEGVSANLGARDCDRARLEASGLPVLDAPAAVAEAMGVSVGALRFLAFHRETSTVTHYARFRVPKRTGGERQISAPKPHLKRAQRWVLDNILARCEVHEAAHGFRGGRSIVSNARPHVRADVVVNLDLKDFFPTVYYPRVWGVFRHMGYSGAVATVLALLCTEPDTVEVELDGITYYVAVGEAFLPQGAPTSPAITNVICRRLDRRLAGAARKLGFAYTRYADDLTFSARGDGKDRVGQLLHQVRWIVEQEGFAVHPDKTRVLRKGARQEVTGVVVNERPSIARDVLRRFRATLYQIEKDGPKGKRWGSGGDVLESIVGFANYVAMVDPERGAPLRERAMALAARYGGDPDPDGGPGEGPEIDRDEAPTDADSPADSDAEPAGDPDAADERGKKWWKVF